MSVKLPAVPVEIMPPPRTRNPTNRNLLRQPHPDWLIEAAFICYIEAGCVVSAAQKLLQERWEAFAPFDIIDAETGELGQPPFEALPKSTWHSWRKRYDWDTHAAREIEAHYPAQARLKAVRAVLGGDIGMAYLIKTVAEDDPGVPARDKIEAAKVLVTVAGEGTLGSINRAAPVVKAIQGHMAEFAAMTPEEINRELRSLIQRTNTPHPERRR